MPRNQAEWKAMVIALARADAAIEKLGAKQLASTRSRDRGREYAHDTLAIILEAKDLAGTMMRKTHRNVSAAESRRR